MSLRSGAFPLKQYSICVQLMWGDRITINMPDAVYVHEVRERTFVAPDDLSVLSSETED